MNSSWMPKREMPSWPDQMDPQKLGGGWGTEGFMATMAFTVATGGPQLLRELGILRAYAGLGPCC